MITNEKGMTLIEVLIALVILLIASVALMQTALLGISMNVQNAMRDEAVNVAEMRMNDLRNVPFPVPPVTNELTATDTNGVIEAGITRNLRGFSITYIPTRTVTDINASSQQSKQVSVSLSWSYKGQTYTHGITTILRKQ